MNANKLMELMKNKKAALKPKAKTLKPKPGSNRYVILPSWRGEDEQFWHDFGQHYIKNESGEIQAVYPCLDKTYGQPCPICEGLLKAQRMTTDDETVNLLKEANSGQTYLLNVLDLDGEDSASPQVLQLGKLSFGQLLEMMEEWGVAVLDPVEPIVVLVTRDGKGLNTKYTVQPSSKKHAIPKALLKDGKIDHSKLNNLDEYVKQENEEQQRRALNAINNVAGLLSAPSGADKPRTASSVDRDDEDLREMEQRRAAEVSRPSPAKADLALDEELDDLLAGMTGTDN
jgi:hypothetical protein